MSVTVHPKGTTIYKPEKCFNGYTGFSHPVEGEAGVVLIDMNGRAINQWKVGGQNIPRARLLESGNMLVLRGREAGGQEYDWDGELVWDCPTPWGHSDLGSHHDIFRKANGNTLFICREETPEEIREQARDPERRECLYSDLIVEVTPDKEVAWEWRECEHLDIDRCNPIPASRGWWAGKDNNTVTDWTHTNTVQALAENKWYDEGDERFKPGNVLLSLRQLDVLLIVDRDTKEIAWEYTGDYKGGLSGQHDSHMIEKGLPGEGNIMVFDNGASPYEDLAHCGRSFVLEINPVTEEVVWLYHDWYWFHSPFTSSCQRLPNGNTLITEAWHGRLFEVTPEGETVWEHVFERGRANRAYRYGYDYCPQADALGRPEEIAVIPEHLPEPQSFNRRGHVDSAAREAVNR